MSLKGNDQKESSKSQGKSAPDVKTKSGAESKTSRLESKELPSRSALPSDKSRSHWNKLKGLRLQNNGSGFESIRKQIPEEKNVCRNSKLLSKTMPSIDATGSPKRPTMSSMPGVSRVSESSTPESHQKNITSNAHQSAISSKWTTSQSGLTAPAAKQSEWKLLKSKLNLLRRKGNRDLENCVETAIVGKEAKEATVRPISGKHERSAQISLIQSSTPPTESILCKRNPQEKGIVCKKEDLMFIIGHWAETSKSAKLAKSKPKTEEDVEASTSTGTTSTGTSVGAVSCVTTSATTATTSGTSVGITTDVSIRRTALKKQHLSTTLESSSDREVNRTKQSNTRTKCLDSCEPENAYKNQYKSKTNTNTTKTSDESVSVNSQNSNSNCLSSDCSECESILKPKNKSKSVKSEPINERNESNLADSETDSQTHNTHNERHNESNESNESESNVPAVQWDDDINFVDPMLLGDAIQTFLRGLAGTGSTTGSATGSHSAAHSTHSTTNEKRVSFKKNS